MMSNTPHTPSPDQPLQRVDGVLRFQANPLVEELLSKYPGGKDGLSKWAEFRVGYLDDHRQLAQLLGRSLDHFSELSYVSEEDLSRAEAAEQKFEEAERP